MSKRRDVIYRWYLLLKIFSETCHVRSSLKFQQNYEYWNPERLQLIVVQASKQRECVQLVAFEESYKPQRISLLDTVRE